jgi:hypothetical protein
VAGATDTPTRRAAPKRLAPIWVTRVREVRIGCSIR